MVLAVLVILLLTLIPITMFGEAVQQLPLARHDQDHESALHAAEAGVEDYINHLNANNNYWTGGNAPGDGNQAFTAWVPVPGPTTTESFRYTVDTTTTLSNGIVYISASGQSCSGSPSTCQNANRAVRTVKVGLRKTGFLDFVYLTDYEIVDPALSGEPTSSCLFHAWEKNPSTGGYGPDINECSVISMTNSATFNGPVHTNDGFYVCGNPTFNGTVDTYYNSPTTRSVAGQTSFAGPGVYRNPSNCLDAPSFQRSGDPASGENLQMPPANTSIQAQGALTGAGFGCLFTGPTTIALHFTANTGYMDVTSPNRTTRAVNANCLNTAQLTQLKAGTTVTNVALPTNGVIYVQNVPATHSDANYTACNGAACLGDVSVSNAATAGGLAGQLTIASDDNVIIAGNLTYHTFPGGYDVLGLVATNDVAVYHPVDNNGNNVAGDITNPTVDAAILSLKHSFYVQNWNQGNTLGTLTVNGTIAQEFRGAVGTFGQSSTGYAKLYTYDTRLSYLTPPYFLNPILSAWRKISFAELKPAF